MNGKTTGTPISGGGSTGGAEKMAAGAKFSKVGGAIGAIGGAILADWLFDAFNDTDIGTAQIGEATSANQKAIEG